MNPHHKQSTIMSKTLELQYKSHKKNHALKWGSVNAAVFAIIAYDLNYKCPYYTTTLHYVEYFLAIVFALNTLTHFVYYIYHTFSVSPIEITLNQKKLLGFKDNDNSFKIKSTPIATRSPSADCSLASPCINLSTKSWLSSSTNNDSMNQSLSSPSWVYSRGSPSMTNYRPHYLEFDSLSDSIVDEQSLNKYLRNVEEKEKNAALYENLENSPKNTSIFWNHPSARTANDVSPMIKKYQYQLAPLNSEIVHTPGVNEEGSPKSLQNLPQVWHKLQLDPQHFTQWNANLRMWISTTILDRVVKEIKAIDDSLLKHGLTDVRIGHVGLERLKKTAQTVQIRQHIPTLGILLPFMEISNNQEYLVQRIKELSSGGCMSDFRWNGGGNLHGKSWDETLPTDSAIIMHFFATYLDTQLLPVAQNPEGLPFTSQHFCKVPDKPQKCEGSLIIHQTCINPPHFLMIIGEETCEISKGRNNLIHTLLLFLHTVATKHHGMLGRVNLGKSGVNVLWVVDQ